MNERSSRALRLLPAIAMGLAVILVSTPLLSRTTGVMAAPPSVGQPTMLIGNTTPGVSEVSGNSEYLAVAVGSEARRIRISDGSSQSLGQGTPACLSFAGDQAVLLPSTGGISVASSPSWTAVPLQPPGLSTNALVTSVVCTPDLQNIVFRVAGAMYLYRRGANTLVDLAVGDSAAGRIVIPHYLTSDGNTLYASVFGGENGAPSLPPIAIDTRTGSRVNLAPPGSVFILSGSGGRIVMIGPAGSNGVTDLETGAVLAPPGVDVRSYLSNRMIKTSNGALWLSETSPLSPGGLRRYVVDFTTGAEYDLPAEFQGPSAGELGDSQFTPDGRYLLFTRTAAAGANKTWYRMPIPSAPAPGASVVELQVAGRAGVPVDASAVVLNVTVTEPTASGFVTVWPCGEGRPTASSVNYVAGQTIPNSVIAKVGAGGKVCLFSLASTHLVVDVNGYFPAGSTFAAVTPQRVLETRADA